MKVKTRVRDFLVENFFAPEGDALADEASLVREGIMDSTGVLELALFLEETYDIQVEDGDFLPENLDSLQAVEDFVLRKKAAGG